MALTRLGSKAITSVENTAINLDAAEIPNLDASKNYQRSICRC